MKCPRALAGAGGRSPFPLRTKTQASGLEEIITDEGDRRMKRKLLAGELTK
jgi:hypothetical protein